ncbi:MAG: CRTAC1 family protein, partial [Gemmatimonadota bacterium]|nr:CRTAC1 family protein [Gemmatimonadota bacterium]
RKTLYRNNGDGTFTDVSFASGTGRVTRPYLGWGVGFFDYNNDGYSDLFAANGHVQDNIEKLDGSTSYPQRNLLFHNNGDGTFADTSLKSGDGMRLVKASRGTAFGDYDNDGDVDLFVLNSNERADLLRNDGGNQNNYLTVRTVGTVSNRDGIGAKVRVVSGRLRQVKEVRSGSSYLSQNDLRVHFGLGSRSTVDTLMIRWPSGTVQVLKNIPVNQVWTVTEQTGP